MENDNSLVEEQSSASDETAVWIFAFRYALERNTSALYTVVQFLIPRLTRFQEWQIKQILDDLPTAVDKEAARRLGEAISEELESRLIF